MVSADLSGVNLDALSSILASSENRNPKIVDTTHINTSHTVNAKFPPTGSFSSVREFETRWEEARWLREVMADWRAPTRGKITAENEIFIDRALTRRVLIHRRLAEGFRFYGGEIGGRHREPFREAGLRSDTSHVLRRVVQIAPKTHRMRVSRTKDVTLGTDTKLFGLDEPWIVLNQEVRSAFRIDLDHLFPSWDALRHEFERLRLPCLPHAVVGFEEGNGTIVRPHAIFLLPYNSGVWFSDDPRCRQDVMSLFRGVHAGITKALLPLGADPGALTNPMRIKNPLSPFWSVRTWNETFFPNLSTWSGWVDTSTSRDRMIRESAAALAGIDRKASNVLFTTFQQWAYETLRALDRANDPDYVRAVMRKDTDTLAEMVFRTLVGRASASAENPKRAQAVLYRVTTYAADHWDPARCSRDGSRDRGACSDEVKDIAGVSARQAVGGRYAASLRKSRSASAIEEAIAEVRAAGEPITKAAIARRTGLDRRTVAGNWPSEAGRR